VGDRVSGERERPAPSRLLVADVLSVGSIGLRTRRLRSGLSALGVAIGIAAMVAVLGLSASSQAQLLATIDELGTNLLTVQPGQSVYGDAATLPENATTKLRALPGVQSVAAVTAVSDATVRRNPFVDVAETGGIAVLAAEPSVLRTLGGRLASGRFLSRASVRFPTVVLGAVAAKRLGLSDHGGARRVQVVIGRRTFTVIGILRPLALAPDVDRSALVGYPMARRAFGTERSASTVYLRADDDEVARVHALAGATANPENPEEVDVSRPSDALQARAAAKGAFTSLLLGLGAVALLVGGVGIANVMVISVIERRSEIGLRRALGATRRHISAQFLTESLLLAALGGVAGSAGGALVTVIASAGRGQPAVVPLYAVAGGVVAALLIGALAGLYPAARASRLSPTEALRTT